MHTEFYHTHLISRIHGVCSNLSRLNEDFPLHGHDFFEFEVVLSGEGIHVVNGVQTPVCSGDCWALGPEDYHLMHSQHMEIMNLRFYRSELPQPFDELFADKAFPLSGRLTDDMETFVDYFSRFSRISEDDKYSEQEGLSYAMLMLVTLLRVFHRTEAEPDCVPGLAYVKKAVEYIYLHYAEPLSLDDVSASINVSSCYLSSLFAEHAGCGFVRFLRRVRVDKAKAALIETNRSIIQIAYDCGFGSISTFDRAFRAVVGQSPADFRKQNREKS